MVRPASGGNPGTAPGPAAPATPTAPDGTGQAAADTVAGATGRASGSRREEILAIAAAIFARKGVVNTTVRDIAREAGMLSGSLYHHFASKEEMLGEIIRTALDADIALDEALARSEKLEPRAAVAELLRRGMLFSADHPDVSAIMRDSSKEFVDTAAYELVRQRDRAIRRAWTRVLERGVADGAFRADLDVDLVFLAMISVVTSAGRWYRPDGPATMHAIADTMAALFLDGLCAGPARPEPADA